MTIAAFPIADKPVGALPAAFIATAPTLTAASAINIGTTSATPRVTFSR